MSSIAFDIGNFVIWSWLMLAPLFVMVVDAIHCIDKTLRHKYYLNGFRFWRGWWFNFAHEKSHHIIGLLWCVLPVVFGITYGNAVHLEWDPVPWALHLIDTLAEPLGWLCIVLSPIPLWFVSIKLTVYLIVKWSKK